MICRPLIDTNVVIDVFLKRDEFFSCSYEVLKLCKQRDINGCISTKSVCDIYYVVNHFLHNKEKALDAVINTTKILPTIPLLGIDIIKAEELKWDDFEDSVIYASCLASKCDAIVTRNKKHFAKAKIPVYTPEEFINKYKK